MNQKPKLTKNKSSKNRLIVLFKRIVDKLKSYKVTILTFLIAWQTSIPALFAEETTGSGGTGITDLDTGIKNLTALLKGLMRGVGGFILIFGAYKLFSSIHSRDAGERREGIWQTIAGILIILIPEIINFIFGRTIV